MSSQGFKSALTQFHHLMSQLTRSSLMNQRLIASSLYHHIGRSYKTLNMNNKNNCKKQEEKKEDATASSTQVTETKKEDNEVQFLPELEARMRYFKEKNQLRQDGLEMDEKDVQGTIVEGLYCANWVDRVPSYIYDKKPPKFMQMTFAEQRDLISADIDVRPAAIKRFFANRIEQREIDLQKYRPERNSILGDDLAAAHFILFREGKVKFMGHDEWVTEYRLDADENTDKFNLPTMQFDVCSLPTTYDPRYIVEKIDASNIHLRFEGLDNFRNLYYCKWLNLQNNQHLEAWSMDKLANMFSDRLEYLDISGCTGFTEGSLCALVRFKKLKTLIVHNLPQLRNLEEVCALLEEELPDVEIIGVDYKQKIEKLKADNERLEKKARRIEASTITIETEPGPPTDSQSEERFDEEYVDRNYVDNSTEKAQKSN